MRRDIHHAVGAAGVAESPLFARIANQPVHAARFAMLANKTARLNAAI